MNGTYEDYQQALEIASWYASQKWCSGADVLTETDGSYSVVWYDLKGLTWYA